MKIVLFSPGAGKPAGINEYFFHTVRSSLIDMGHRIIDFDYLENIEQSGHDMMHRKLKEVIEREEPEIFLHSVTGDELDREFAKYVKNSSKTTSISFYGDEDPATGSLFRNVDSYNFALVTDPGVFEDLKRNGHHNVMLTRWACAPYLLPSTDQVKKYDVTFIGRPYKGRPELVSFLKKNGIDIRVWGSGWEDIVELRDIARGFLPLYKYYEIMALSKIVIGMTWSSTDAAPRIKRRTFESAACRAFQIVTHNQDLFNLFEDNREIVTYKDEKDLLAKIRYYLDREGERSKIAESAYKRVMEEHTWERRLAGVFGDIGKKLPKNKLTVTPIEKRQTGHTVTVHSRPKISVLTYVYNGEKYIKDAIESVIAQTYKDLEYLILDDGSTDNTAKIVRRFLGDKRLKYVYQENIGQDLLHFNELANRSVALTTGEFIDVIGADDIYLPYKLERQLKEFEKDPGLDIVFSDLFFVDERGSILPGDYKSEFSYTFTRDTLLRILFRQNIVAHPTALMRRKSLELLGGFETGFAADYHFWLKAAPHQGFKFVDEKLMKYRVHEQGASTGSRSRQVAFEESNRVVSMMRNRYTILDLYPEIESCNDRNKAVHDAYLEFGRDLLMANLKQPQLALNEFMRALQQMGNSVMALNNAGIAYVYLGEYEKARAMFNELRRYPSINDDMRRNIFTLEQILNGQNPPEVSFLVATETDKGSQLHRAINPHRDSLQDEENRKSQHQKTYELVEPLVQSGKYEEAIAELEKLLDFYPEIATIYNDIGTCSYQLGLNGSALGYFERALQIDPAFTDTKKNLVNLYLGLGKLEEAIDILEGILKQTPDDEEMLLLTADIFCGCNRHDDAVFFYERTLSVNPQNASAVRGLQNLKAMTI